MTLDTARTHILAALTRMQAAYGQAVFDEWAVLGFGPRGGVLAYGGPRGEAFRRDLPADAAALRAEAAQQESHVGDLVFTLEGAGKQHDALMRLGDTTFLVCNHTGKSMTEIRADPGWLKAQAVYFELGEKFRADPLEV